MKNASALHIFLFMLLTLHVPGALAQDYVITTRGDSLTGEVKPLLYGPEKKVQLRSDDEEMVLSLFDIRTFSYEDEIYHPVKGESGYVFMKLLRPGYLSLYAFRPENQTRYDGLLLKKLDGARMVVPNIGFRKYMSQFLEDCPAVVEKIEERELGKKNLNELIDAYNGCIERRTMEHTEETTLHQEQVTKLNSWDALEEKVREKDFSEKTNALDMITEIRKKIRRQEEIPNFLLEGLKSSLQGIGVNAELETAIRSTN